MSETGQPIAVFDFDNTLVQQDSLWIFFALVAGWPRVLLACVETLSLYTLKHFICHDDRIKIDRGTFFKQLLLQRLIAGISIESLKGCVQELKRRLRWNDDMRRTLQEHFDQGHQIVIASGALSLYLPELVRELPHHALLCTDIDIVDGKATANMPHGNCVRQTKAERVTSYMKAHGPFGESWGYGNFPDDVPMLNLMKHRILV